MKIVFIGCVQFSLSMLQQLLKITEAQVIGIVTREQSSFNSDFVSLAPLANQYNIPVFFAQKNEQDSLRDWIVAMEPDIIYCFGWSYLLRSDIIDIPEKGIIGYHPAELPKNRGRHPIIWPLVLGLGQTASTFFYITEDADSGKIIDQKIVAIDSNENARTLYNKLENVAKAQLKDFTLKIITGTLISFPQDESQSNHWRKRSKEDGKIDWRMSAKAIDGLVRALSKPYPGAHCLFDDKEVKIWKVEIQDTDTCNIEPGKVIDVSDTRITVKCYDKAIQIVDHEFIIMPKKGSYL